MACYCPNPGWRAKEPNPDTGKRPIVFHPKDAALDEPVDLPCGKCTGCRADQSLMWAIRAYHESLDHERNCFVTLTIDDDHLRPHANIDKRDLQLFFKRLRKHLPPKSLRYIACGEYGAVTGRPHYHALLFGVDFRDYQAQKMGETQYTHPLLEQVWGQGQVCIDSVTMGTICYTCGYVLKKIYDSDTFALFSRRPGIGKRWLDLYLDDLTRTGKVVIEGREYAIPSRYLRWNEEEFDFIKRERMLYAKSRESKLSPVERLRRLDAQQINRKALLNQKVDKL